MDNFTPEKQNYIKMLDALKDLGPTFNASAQLQQHYKKPVAAHNDLLSSNSKYSKMFNAYCSPEREQKESDFTIGYMTANTEKEPLRTIKMFGQLIKFLPAAYMQYRRESKLADMGISHQPK